MTFSTPLALLLLLVIPYFVWLGRPHKGSAHPRDWASLVLRLLIMLLLVFGLAGAQAVRAADELTVVFLIDASDSMSPAQKEQAEALVRKAIEGKAPEDRAAVVVFGANALVERPASTLSELAAITTIPNTTQSDIGEAIRLGLALFPAGNARRMVLISDGADTTGDALETAKLAAASGVQIDVIPLPRQSAEAEALLTGVRAPARVGQGETFEIEIDSESSAATPAEFRILADGVVVDEFSAQLNPGNNNFARRLQGNAEGFARYTVQMVPLEDAQYQNNQLSTFTQITGPPAILLVARESAVDNNGHFIPDESPQLAQALASAGLDLDRVTPAQLPSVLEELSDYASILLVNVNARDLSSRKMAALQSYVQNLGGGLVVVGGPESYGMGGYFRTPLEETLPVEMQLKDQERFPSVSMALVIDRSGSMAAQEGGVEKIQLAAEAAVRVVELLNDFDEITIIPVDSQADNPIGPAMATEREEIIAQVRGIGAGGGGIFVRTGLEAAADALAGSPNEIRHIILLADGADSEQKEGVPELIEALVEEGITLTTVSIGLGQDTPWLEQMAELGNGRFHFTDQAANLPQIFTQETTSIQRSYLIEERFFPSLGNSNFSRNHPIFLAMERAGATRVPPLFGYVGTSPKGSAQVILETHMGDPLLAAWEFGLGRAVAWTSDASGHWGVEWVRWDGFATFWSNVVRWSVSQDPGSDVETTVTLEGESAHLVVDARDGDSQFLNNLVLSANIVNPEGGSTALSLQQRGPGRYEATFSPEQEGAYIIRVSGTAPENGASGDDIAVGQISGWVLGYSPEYLSQNPQPGLMTAIAGQSGGRILAAESEPDEDLPIFDHDLPGSRLTRPIWPWLLTLATVLLPLDIAIRRLAIGRRDLVRIRAATFGRLRSAETIPAEHSERVQRLFRAKRRAGSQGEDTVGASKEGGYTPPGADARLENFAGEQPPSMQGTARESESVPGTAEPADGEGSLAARLLARRRQQQREHENGADSNGST